MKKILLLVALALPAAAQNVTLQKTPAAPAGSGANNLTAASKVVVVPSGGSITAIGSGSIVATGGTASTMPWAGLTAIPSPTFSVTGAATGNVTLLASGGATFALTLATVNSNVGTFAGITLNSKGLATAASALTSAAAYGIANGAAIDAIGAVSSNGILQRTASNTYSVTTFTGGSLGWASGNLTLSGDSASPGNGYLYGTTSAGTKGWRAQNSDAAATASGATTTLTPGSLSDVENVTLSGSAGARAIVVATTGAVAGARVEVLFAIPATSGLAVTVYSGSTSGPVLQTFTTTGASEIPSARLSLSFSGSNWQPIFYQGPIP